MCNAFLFVCGVRDISDKPKLIFSTSLIAVAINVARFVAWINEMPLAATRTSAFATLADAESEFANSIVNGGAIYASKMLNVLYL